MDDVERDLRELTTNSLLKDIMPELEGWGTAVRSAIKEGTSAARFALDPRQRDKAFAIRRQLGDYARMARLVGSLTPTMSLTYRKFAQSLDEVAAVLLVLMGEALANMGFSGRQCLLQVPYTELQVRRNAVIYALRNLIGATQEAYGPNDWPRGLDAYRRLFERLELQGQGDLRALLLEVELARSMDELIQRADHGRAQGLRALGATVQLDLERFRRLVIIGQPIEEPALIAFLEALQLFTDAFNPSGGFRLLNIARPPILFYGLYGLSSLGSAANRLVALIQQRGLLADRLDCFMECGCSQDVVRCQVLLDKILYDVDRAIDLYALGTLDDGIPERRAGAYGYLIQAFLALHAQTNSRLRTCNLAIPTGAPTGDPQRLDTILNSLGTLLRDVTKDPVMQEELCVQRTMEQQWENLVATMAPSCIRSGAIFQETLEPVITAAIRLVVGGDSVACPPITLTSPQHPDISLQIIAERFPTPSTPPPQPTPPQREQRATGSRSPQRRTDGRR